MPNPNVRTMSAVILGLLIKLRRLKRKSRQTLSRKETSFVCDLSEDLRLPALIPMGEWGDVPEVSLAIATPYRCSKLEIVTAQVAQRRETIVEKLLRMYTKPGAGEYPLDLREAKNIVSSL